jgi:thioredoxin-like negative regulator of GroEL
MASMSPWRRFVPVATLGHDVQTPVLPTFGNSRDLGDIEERLAKAPDDVSLPFSRACMLDTVGRNDAA